MGCLGEEQNVGQASADWLLPGYLPTEMIRLIKETSKAFIINRD